MCQLTEYMLYNMILHVGEMYCKEIVVFFIIKVKFVLPLLLTALIILFIPKICNKIQGF